MKLKCLLLYSAVLICSAHSVKAATIGVGMRDNYFNPTNIVIRPMDRVIWTNFGGTTHDSTSRTNLWRSPLVNPGATYSFTFTNLGYYPYFCFRHSSSPQTGTVSVVNASLASIITTPTNAQFEVRGGRQGLRAVVEAGGSLAALAPISTNGFPASGTLRFTNNAPPPTNRFYRARVVP